jgi:hypothetical protein
MLSGMICFRARRLGFTGCNESRLSDGNFYGFSEWVPLGAIMQFEMLISDLLYDVDPLNQFDGLLR